MPTDAGSRSDRSGLGLAAAAVLLAAADTYVVVVALPSIMSGVGVGLERLQRATPIISGFLLGYTVVLPLIGRVADLIGIEPVLKACLVVFATGSVVTATAHSLPVVVAGRAVQGLGGGGLVPVAMAMVAARWPPEERGLPLGALGAVQELGSVVGPLYGAGVVALASWRAIFWINVPLVCALAVGFRLSARRGPDGNPRRGRPDLVGAALGLLGSAGLALGLDAPASLATDPTVGRAYEPAASGAWAAFTTPIVLASLGLLVLFVCWELAAPGGVRHVAGSGAEVRRLAGADFPGAALLGGVLACVVVAFSTEDPGRQVVSSSAPFVLPASALLAAAFWVRQRTARSPLVQRGGLASRPAWGALVVNAVLGAALMAVLVDVPLFARATVDSGSEVSAALVLLRFLAGVPVGALAGGAMCRRSSRAPAVAGGAMTAAAAGLLAMSSWSSTALGGGPRPSDVELVVCGLGFGMAIAPVNVSILGAVKPGLHALASALVVVARTVGMLVGLSALTAVALHRFYRSESHVESPLLLCPGHPASCPQYDEATTRAVLQELHTVFAGAALCAALAAVLSAVLLRQRNASTGARAPTAPAGSAAGQLERPRQD